MGLLHSPVSVLLIPKATLCIMCYCHFHFTDEENKAEVKLLAHTSNVQRWCSLNSASQTPGKPEARQKASEPCKVNDSIGGESDVTVTKWKAMMSM